MLYVTTRNNLDAFPSGHVLEYPRVPEGGGWKPFRAPKFSREEIAGLKELSFNAVMAQVLNRLFDRKLTPWDIDFCIGRYPVRLKSLPNRLHMGEPWHNPEWQFDNMANRLIRLIGGNATEGWTEMAVRIAVLFGIYAEVMRQGNIRSGETIDVAVLSGSFMEPMSAWYARQWGLPVGNIVCCCNENNGIWNLICHGQFRTDEVARETCVPGADVIVPEELERLICECGSTEEMEDYLGCCRTGRTFFPNEETLAQMRNGLYVSVVSSDRIPQTISGVFASHAYVLSPESALVYSGLQDYRAKKGQLRQAVIMTNRSPALDAAAVAKALDMDADKIKDFI